MIIAYSEQWAMDKQGDKYYYVPFDDKGTVIVCTIPDQVLRFKYFFNTDNAPKVIEDKCKSYLKKLPKRDF